MRDAAGFAKKRLPLRGDSGIKYLTVFRGRHAAGKLRFFQIEYTESYRSGHNGAVLKTVRAQVHAGSNPALSATSSQALYRLRRLFMLRIKSHLVLTPLLLLSKSNPLRWASIWLSGAAQ